jgi:GntR family transcriptional regulator, transcriptional repressor for pyruvate dehydrogenase complex
MVFRANVPGVDYMEFKEIKSRRLSDSVVSQIKKSIISGTYRPGDKLPSEKELMEIFNVSRGSLREALRALEQFGFIVVKAGASGGAYVTGEGMKSLANRLYDIMLMEQVSFEEILQVRQLIEPGMARLAAENRTDENISELEDLNLARETAIKAGKIHIIVNIDFHQALAKATKNKMVCLLIDAIALIFSTEFKRISLSLRDHQAILKSHKIITKYIKNRDAENAIKATYEHTIDVINRLKA